MAFERSPNVEFAALRFFFFSDYGLIIQNKSQTTNEEIVEVENEQGLFASPSKELEIKEEEIDAISEDTVESSQENSLFAEEQSTVNRDSFVGHPAKLPEGNIDDEEDDFDDLLR